MRGKISPYRKRIFGRLLIYFSALVCLVIIALSLGFSNLYLESMRGRRIGQAQFELDRINKAFTAMIRTVDQISLFAHLDTGIEAYLGQSQENLATTSEAIPRISRLSQINPYIYSIYCYNFRTDNFLNSGHTGFDIRRFLADNAEVWSDKERNFVIRSVRLDAKLSNPLSEDSLRKHRLLTFAYIDRYFYGKQPLSLVIINLNSEMIEQDFFAYAGSRQAIFGDPGQILLASEAGIYDNQALVAELSAAPADFPADKTGSRESGTGRNASITLFARADDGSFATVARYPARTLVGEVRTARLLIICLTAVLILLCVGLIFLLVRRVYVPIRNMADYVASVAPPRGGETSETELIFNAYRDAQRERLALEQKQLSDEPIVQAQLLKQLLLNSRPEEAVLAELAANGLAIERRGLVFLLIRVDGFRKMPGNRQTIANKLIPQRLNMLLHGRCPYALLPLLNGDIALLISGACPADQSEIKTRQILQSFQAELTASFGFSATIAQCAPLQEDASIQEAYRQAQDLIRQRFVLGYGAWIDEERVARQLHASASYPQDLQTRMEGALRADNAAAYRAEVDQLIELLGGTTQPDATQILIRMIFGCIQAADGVLQEGRSRIEDVYTDIGALIQELETLEQARNWFIRLFEEFEERLHELTALKATRNDAKIRDIQKYVRDNCQDINMSVESLAETAGLSANYFSRIFKDLIGVSAGDFIRRTRIEKARTLLRETNMKISLICEQTGFVNASHFYAAFHKDTGLTPAAYRAQFQTRAPDA